MKIVTSQEEYDKAKSRALIELECYECKKIFTKTKHYVHNTLNKNWHSVGKYCSIQCAGIAGREKVKTVCKHCNKELIKRPSDLRINNFCNHSCRAIYQNAHKTTGCRRSKLEIWLQSQLSALYPQFKIQYNYRLPNACELDIYIPELQIAFELNGPFHYEPIFGEEKLKYTQHNDSRKFKHCIDNNIGLCIIDVSKDKYFKIIKSSIHLKYITDIINSKLT